MMPVREKRDYDPSELQKKDNNDTQDLHPCVTLHKNTAFCHFDIPGTTFLETFLNERYFH